MKVDLTKSEILSLLMFMGFIAFWSFMFIPLCQVWIQETVEPNPILFYPIFNVVYVILFTFLTYMLLRVLGKPGSLIDLLGPAFRYGLAGFILLWMIPDLIAPPYLITFQGVLLKNSPLWAAVSDSFWYTLLQPYIPQCFMYCTVYFVIPLLMFLAVLLLVSPRQLARLVQKL
jgi:hypothetical protein